ncbi:MAG: hypothetical protein M0Z31_11840 [Clostridia bacterium]|nr:hypothetical protein [Clostridia bacterium]
MLGFLFIYLAGLALIIWLELPALVKQKQWREVAAFSGLVLIGSYLSISMILRLPTPNPNVLIEAIFGPLSKMLEAALSGG